MPASYGERLGLANNYCMNDCVSYLSYDKGAKLQSKLKNCNVCCEKLYFFPCT